MAETNIFKYSTNERLGKMDVDIIDVDLVTDTDATKGIKAVADLETSGTDDNDIVYGYAVHDSALYYAFSKEAKVSASYRHAYLSTLVTCESVYGGVAINALADGDRRIIGLIDYE